jgi:hypothetical protein
MNLEGKKAPDFDLANSFCRAFVDRSPFEVLASIEPATFPARRFLMPSARPYHLTCGLNSM